MKRVILYLFVLFFLSHLSFLDATAQRVSVELRVDRIKTKFDSENFGNQEMMHSFRYSIKSSVFSQPINSNEDFARWENVSACIIDPINQGEINKWIVYNKRFFLGYFDVLKDSEIRLAYRGFENDEGNGCFYQWRDKRLTLLTTDILRFSNLAPGEWHEIKLTSGNFDVEISFRYSIPQPEKPTLNNKNATDIICANSEVTLSTDVKPNNDGITYEWEYYIKGDDFETYNPDLIDCYKSCSDKNCAKQCDIDYPQTILIPNIVSMSFDTKDITFYPNDLFGKLNKSSTVEFKVKANSINSSSSWSATSIFNFAPAAPTIDESLITYQEACFDKGDGVINLPLVTSVASVKYILKNEGDSIGCDPEISVQDCLDHEGSATLKPDRKIDGNKKGKYKLWLANPGGVYGACYSEYDVEMPELDELLLQANIVQELSCNNSNDAKIEFSSSGGHAETKKYTVNFDGDADEYFSPQTLENQLPGNYIVSVSDKCTIDESGNPVYKNNISSFEIHNPARVTINSITPYNPTCLDPGNGKILVNAGNSDSDKYIYQLRNGNNDLINELKSQGANFDYDQLTDGDYTIKALDNERPSCPGDTKPFSLDPPQAININDPVIAAPDCPGENGTIGLVATGESIGFEYILKNDQNQVIKRNNTGQFAVPAGKYYASVRYDIEGCNDITNYSEVLNMPGEAPPAITLNASDASCNGGENGSIVAIIDQNKNFSYHWEMFLNGGWVDLNAAGELQITSLEAGEYRLKIIDEDKGCEFFSDPTTINQPDELYISEVQLIKAGCTASTTQVNMDIVGGAAPYSWYYSKENASFVAFTNEDQLTPGTYQFKAIDDNNCEVNYGQEIVITEEAMNLIANVTPVCYKSNNGSLEAEIMGGDAPYSYSIDDGGNFQNDAFFDQLAAGNYQLLVKDSRGCEATLIVEVPSKEDTPEINFLVATRQNALDTLVIKEISNPKPDSLHWQFDSRAIVIDDNPWEPMVQFMQEGDYPVSITAWFDQCEYTMEKILHIRPFDPNAYVEVPVYQRPIEILTANPNPSDGDLNVEVKMFRKQTLMLVITDVRGLEHYRKVWQAIENITTTIDLSQQVEGTYFLRAITENDVRELKIILQK